MPAPALVIRRLPLIVLLALAVPSAVRAQAGDGLRERNHAFLRALHTGARDSIAAEFFPRAGEWTWVHTLEGAPATSRVTTRRFAAGETRRTIGTGGPACWSFEPGWDGGVSLAEPLLLGVQATAHTRWRRVGGNRFVPPGASAASPVFVQWRREDGRWVVSSFGDAEAWEGPPLAGIPADLVRDTVTELPPTPVYATSERWFVNNEPFVFGGRHYFRYRQPRAIDPDLLHRVGRRGMVGVYAERGGPDLMDVLYIPTAKGEYQPYDTEGPLTCG
jgi:hypothetical protein